MNDSALDTNPRTVQAIRPSVQADRSSDLTADGECTDADAMTKGEGEDRKDQSNEHDSTKNSDGRGKQDKECLQRKTERDIAWNCKKRIDRGQDKSRSTW